MKKASLFVAAVLSLYLGGFVYDEMGPFFYTFAIALLASLPHLLKFTFWKKLLLLLPTILLRVVGKILLSIFGKSTLPKLLARYASLEVWLKQTLASFKSAKDKTISRWATTSNQSRAYLLLIFLPVAIVILLVSIVIEIVRMKFVQFIFEKILQIGFVTAGKKVDISKVGETIVRNVDASKVGEKLPFLNTVLIAGLEESGAQKKPPDNATDDQEEADASGNKKQHG